MILASAASLDDSGSGYTIPQLPSSFGRLDGDRALKAAIRLYIRLNHSDSDHNVARKTFMSFNDHQVKKETTEVG